MPPGKGHPGLGWLRGWKWRRDSGFPVNELFCSLLPFPPGSQWEGDGPAH